MTLWPDMLLERWDDKDLIAAARELIFGLGVGMCVDLEKKNSKQQHGFSTGISLRSLLIPYPLARDMSRVHFFRIRSRTDQKFAEIRPV